MRLLLYILGFYAVFYAQTASSEVLAATDKVVEKFMALDLDASESVSYGEYKTMVLQRLEERFEAMDSNNDKQINANEYRTFWRNTKSQYYRFRR